MESLQVLIPLIHYSSFFKEILTNHVEERVKFQRETKGSNRVRFKKDSKCHNCPLADD
jgi:hypothetical protein